jgi:hypothetical protein
MLEKKYHSMQKPSVSTVYIVQKSKNIYRRISCPDWFIASDKKKVIQAAAINPIRALFHK